MSDQELIPGLKVANGTVDAAGPVLQKHIDELRRRAVSW